MQRNALVIVMMAGLAACASFSAPPTALEPVNNADLINAGIELPIGPGREYLRSACLSCHDLGGLGLFAGFYTRDSWKVLVLTMIEHGAELKASEIEIVSDYLAQHFGTEQR